MSKGNVICCTSLSNNKREKVNKTKKINCPVTEHPSRMRRRKEPVDWKLVEGAFSKRRRLYLTKDKQGLDHCPVAFCDHPGFASRRGCRKHVNVKHGWYLYFDHKPNIEAAVELTGELRTTFARDKTQVPCCSTENVFARSFSQWLQSTTGGGKSRKQADVSVKRALKFLKFCCEETGEEEDAVLTTVEVVDYFLSCAKLLTDFLDKLETEWQMGQSGRIGYVSGISDLLDYRKFNSPSASVLQNFSVTEVYIKRARKCLTKNMRSHWTTDLDVETLESRRSWASLSELQSVVPFHIERYQSILEKCKNYPASVTPSDLTFATRFVAVFMFVRVKGCRPMTYQHLSVQMFESAKSNEGMVDQKIFKTAEKYGFDSLYFDQVSLKIVDDYIRHVRPLLNPSCDYVLLNRNGVQFKKLTELLSVLVFQAIGKYIPPTRYRQIIETESSTVLNAEEQKCISEDQKHSSNVARVHYQKKRSREIAIKARVCMEKLRGNEGKVMDERVEDELHTTETPANERDCATEVNIERPTQKPVKFAGRKQAVRFTKDEDDCIRKGIEMFGLRWTTILRHTDFKFHTCRVPNTLRKRAEALKLV